MFRLAPPREQNDPDVARYNSGERQSRSSSNSSNSNSSSDSESENSNETKNSKKSYPSKRSVLPVTQIKVCDKDLPSTSAKPNSASTLNAQLPIWEDYMPDLKKDLKDLAKYYIKKEQKNKKRKKRSSSSSSSSSSNSSRSSSNRKSDHNTIKINHKEEKSKKSRKEVDTKEIDANKKTSKKIKPSVTTAVENPKPVVSKRKQTPAQRKKTIVSLAKRLTEALEESF